MDRDSMLSYAAAMAALTEARYRREFAAGAITKAEAKMDQNAARVLLRRWLARGADGDPDLTRLEQPAEYIVDTLVHELINPSR